MEDFPERRADGGVVRMGFHEVGHLGPVDFSMAAMALLFVAGHELHFESDFIHFEVKTQETL